MLRIERAGTREWTFATDGAWFRAPGGPTVDLSDRVSLRRILATLLAADGPVLPQDLVIAGWPGARLVGDSGIKRLRSAVWTLRKLGLDGIVTSSEGYRLVRRDRPLGRRHASRGHEVAPRRPLHGST